MLYRIGIFFRYDLETQQKLKLLGAVYSATHKCWYVDYSPEKYKLLKTNFDDINIENPLQTSDAGTDIRYVQELLGHKDIRTTMIYSHLSQPLVDRVQSPAIQRAVAKIEY